MVIDTLIKAEQTIITSREQNRNIYIGTAKDRNKTVQIHK